MPASRRRAPAACARLRLSDPADAGPHLPWSPRRVGAHRALRVASPGPLGGTFAAAVSGRLAPAVTAASAVAAVRTIVSSLCGPAGSSDLSSRCGSVVLVAYPLTIVSPVPRSRLANAITRRLVGSFSFSSALDRVGPGHHAVLRTVIELPPRACASGPGLRRRALSLRVFGHCFSASRPAAGDAVGASSPLCPSSSTTGWLLLPRGPRCPPAPGRSAVLDIGASPCRRLVPAPCVAGPLVGPVRLVRLVRDSSVTDRGPGLGDLLRSCSRPSSSGRNRLRSVDVHRSGWSTACFVLSVPVASIASLAASRRGRVARRVSSSRSPLRGSFDSCAGLPRFFPLQVALGAFRNSLSILVSSGPRRFGFRPRRPLLLVALYFQRCWPFPGFIMSARCGCASGFSQTRRSLQVRSSSRPGS